MSTRLSEMNLPRFPLLKDKEMRELIAKAQTGDGNARETLINCNLKLVFNLVQRFANRGYEIEDLFQIGVIGLMKAVDKFDFTYEVKFSTYAVPMIIGEIRRFLRDDNPVKVSRSLKETAFKINRVKEELTSKLGREPSLTEIEKELGIDKEELINAMESVQTPSSIYETLYQDDGDPIYLLDQLTNDSIEEDPKWFDKIAIKETLMKIPERERQIILYRFFEDKTQTEVAEIIGLSQVQVSRLERQALINLRKFMEYKQKNE